jgi:dTDP-4-amino-4,6-dideoxygalactose transaminase
LPSDIIAAFLYAQLENIEEIQAKRRSIWNLYYNGLKPLEEKGHLRLPIIPEYATNNAHMFYILCENLKERNKLTRYLQNNGILAIFHYLPLHKSPFYKDRHDGRDFPNSDRYSDCLVRLPMYYELCEDDVDSVIRTVTLFFRK